MLGERSVNGSTEGSISKADALITLLQCWPHGHYSLARPAYLSAGRTGLITVLAGRASFRPPLLRRDRLQDKEQLTSCVGTLLTAGLLSSPIRLQYSPHGHPIPCPSANAFATVARSSLPSLQHLLQGIVSDRTPYPPGSLPAFGS